MIITENDGPLVLRSNYWQTEMASEGFYYVSPNAGVIRMLVPESRRVEIADMRTAEEVVLTRGVHTGRGSWPEYKGRELMEILFDDHTDNPFALWLSLEQWERLPDSQTDYGRTWEFTAWEDRRGTPHRVLTKLCYLRKAPLPCMQPWG